MKRLFCAIDLPERIIDEITTTYQAIEGAQWVDEEKLHITMRFCGDTSPGREQVLTSHLRKLPITPFTLALKGVGQFPLRNSAKILWVGVKPSAELKQLQHRIEHACVAAGFPGETRLFSPHITVARISTAHPDRIARFLVSNSLFTTEQFEVNAFHLYASELHNDGSRYTKEISFFSETTL